MRTTRLGGRPPVPYSRGGRGAGWRGRAGGRRWRAIRRTTAIALIVLAGWIASRDATPIPGTRVLVLTHDLQLGATLTAADLSAQVRSPVPDGALSDPAAAIGRRLSSSARRGEVLTDARLVDRTRADPGPGRSAIAVRPADRAVGALLQPGMSVSLAGVDTDGVLSRLTGDAVVLAVLPDASDSSPPVLFSVPAADVDRVTAATVTGDVVIQFS